MDSLSQLALGAAVSVAVAGPRAGVARAAMWGAICGTLPDLDVLIDHGDPIRNMTLHRAESHSLVYLTLAAPLVAAVICRIHRQFDRFRHWWLAVWLALVTHPLLDAMTIYGTRLLLPFTDHPYGVGSIFIIDPLYTLPLLAGTAVALLRRDRAGQRWNALGLLLSTAYLGWSALAQASVAELARESAAGQGLPTARLLAQPTPFNTVLWRVLVLTPEGYAEGFYSLLDPRPVVRFDRFPVDPALYPALAGDPGVARLAVFTHGFFALRERGDAITISDLRMGQEPLYTFSFLVARVGPGGLRPVAPELLRFRPDIPAALGWVAGRIRDPDLPPLRQPLPPAASPPAEEPR